MKPQPYLAIYNNQACLADLDPVMDGEAWDRTHDQFRGIFRARYGVPEEVAFVRLYPSQYRRNVYWEEWVTSAQGASFHLFPMEDATKEDIEACKQIIRTERDVVRLTVYQIRKWHHLKSSKPMTDTTPKKDTQPTRLETICAKLQPNMGSDVGLHHSLSQWFLSTTSEAMDEDLFVNTELRMGLEDHFDLEITDGDAVRITTVQDILDYLTRRLGPDLPDDKNVLRLTEAQFDDRYKPYERDGSYVQYEWDDKKAAIQKAIAELRCWTMVDGDSGDPVILWGNRTVNRMYNILTSSPLEDESWEVEITND